MATLAPSPSVDSETAVTVTRIVSAVGTTAPNGRHVILPEIGKLKKL